MQLIMNKAVVALLMISCFTSVVSMDCPFLRKQKEEQNALRQINLGPRQLNSRTGDGGIPDGGYDVVKQDIIDTVLTNSQDFWPADFQEIGPHYGPFMIRLAWHCAGSYRESDGRGGCDGGRIRFDPELNWPDNGNLNQALELLKPIKEKYGSQLSWGDLIILAGNAAIESMGGPVLGFCGGRIDDADGGDSLILGPSPEQEAIAPCLSIDRQGQCNAVEGSPIGPTTVGLIYVNPGGPVGSEGDPVASANDIRRAFANMGFNDTESVSLIGGGHAFGKTHGACDDPPCGRGTDMEGKGLNTVTSGFEGKWTTRPTTWSNDFFTNLFGFTWTLSTGPGGNIQWEPSNEDGSAGPDIIMLTSDIALTKDESYEAISTKYATDLAALEKDFMHSWYRLTTGDMGPRSRCLGDNVPDAQSFQSPLPSPPTFRSDFIATRSKIQDLLDADASNFAAFVNLAYQCASTFRASDYRGGCNGARIRFAPESEWEVNSGTKGTLQTLAAIQEEVQVSMSDIIVLAGQVAIERAGGKAMAFCGGRVDAFDAVGSDMLAPRTYAPAVVSIRDDMQVKGLSDRQGVALAARSTLSNKFFKDLIAGDGDFTNEELALLEAEFKAIVEEYAENEESFQAEFANAWTYLMTADRYMGPFDNSCTDVNDATLPEGSSGDCPPGLIRIGDSICICFPGQAQVQLEGGQTTTMDQLQLGDSVLVDDGTYSKVYSFGHSNANVKSEYIQIHSKDLEQPLKVSANHLVFINANDAVPASQLKKGGLIYTMSTGKSSVIIDKIATVTAKGAYAPFTYAGTIVVNDVMASSYIAMDHSKSTFELAGVPFVSHHWGAHISTAPLRLYCQYVGSCTTTETYTAEGLSHMTAGLYVTGTWLMSLESGLLQMVILLPAFGIALLAAGLEQVLMAATSAYYMGAVLVGVVYYRRTARSTTKA